MLDNLKSKFDLFLALAQEAVPSRPWLVAILMHEYFRNLYPTDPYVPFPSGMRATDRIHSVLDACIRSLEGSEALGSYFAQRTATVQDVVSLVASSNTGRPGEAATQQVYGKLWDTFDADVYMREASRILDERLANSGFVTASLEGRTVLDMGCGSGRYTIALAMAGPRTVYGVDMGAASIRTAARIAHEAGLRNIGFHVGSVLQLPHRDNAFDFVFCNGVLHHTEDMEQGIRELHRVLKPGGRAFLYLYADGGLFWYSRKRMPVVMKQIPQEYTMAVLDLIGMPRNRFFFVDNWYVPRERHTTRSFLEPFLREVGFAELRKINSGRATDLDNAALREQPDAQILWGDGEHRYLLAKA